MFFQEQIAQGLDREGIESRLVDEDLFVPLSAEVELRFSRIDSIIPAAELYVTANGVEDDPGILIGVVFTVKNAVRLALQQIGVDQAISLIDTLCDGQDDRLAGLEFYPDSERPYSFLADISEQSQIKVEFAITHDGNLEFKDDGSLAAVRVVFRSFTDGLGVEPSAEAEVLPGFDTRSDLEEIDLGLYSDHDRLLGVVSAALDHVDRWEELLQQSEDDI